MTDSVSAKQQSEAAPRDERDLLLEHNYDGIQEYDNPMPRWWVLVFWGTFLFALGYFFHYQLSPNGVGIHEEYEADMEVAAAEAEKRALAEQVTEDSLAALLKQEPMVLAGQAIFQQHCVTCHAAEGRGKIGPNLTDQYFLHGGHLVDIYTVIRDGVPAKGMISWGKQLKPIQLRQVAAYVGTLRGKNLPGKEPQGEPMADAAGGPAPSASIGAERTPPVDSAAAAPSSAAAASVSASGSAAPAGSGAAAAAAPVPVPVAAPGAPSASAP